LTELARDEDAAAKAVGTVIRHEIHGTIITTEGDVADQYIMGVKLGAGKYASVYLCTDKKDQKWAMKIFHKKDRSKQKIYEIIKEANTMRTVAGHPNIAKIQDIIETRERVLLTMEYLSGGQLYDEVLRRKHFSEKMASHIIGQLVSALKHCHEKGVIHCDLKPENVMCTSDPTKDEFDIKLTDFGLSKVLVPDADQVLTYCGTPLYMAPEMIKREQYGKAVDMWSVGCMAHELLCGQPPFCGRNRNELEKNVKGFRGLKRFRKDGLPPGPTTQHILDEWATNKVQEAAQDLIAHLLHYKAEERITAADASQNAWLGGNAVYAEGHMAGMHEKLLTSQVRRKLKRACTKLQIVHNWAYMTTAERDGMSLAQKIKRVNKAHEEAQGCKCSVQ